MKYYIANMNSKEDLYAATWKYVQVILLNFKKYLKKIYIMNPFILNVYILVSIY